MKKARNAFIRSVLVLLLCVSMLVGTTFAWFSETITNTNNRIMAGNLDVAMYWTDDLTNGTWVDAEDLNAASVFDYDNWEPGYTVVRYIKIVNEGSLALKYQLSILADGVVGPLADVIDVYFVQDAQANITDRSELAGLTSAGALTDVLQNGIASTGAILPAGKTKANFYSGEVVVAIAMKMRETAGNEYMNKSVGTSFSIALTATQTSEENDSFGDNYDASVEFPELEVYKEITMPVTVDSTGKTVSEAKYTSPDNAVSATIPVGTQLKDGVTELKLTISSMETTNPNVQVKEDEIVRSVDVHVEGVAEGNTKPIAVYMQGMMPIGLSEGNYKLYHVENGNAVEMSPVVENTPPIHNRFKYYSKSGDVILYLESFSEIATVVAEEPTWQGGFDYSWYNTTDEELYIVSADQLAAFGAIVGGMAKNIEQDSFENKTVKLLADINIGDTDSENGFVFYPIGYWNSEGTYEKSGTAISSGFYAFQGTFDGNGNTIANFYQNTWEMKGDHNWYAPEDQHYRDGMGLFGKVYGGTVRNLSVNNFSCDGEITTTGVIAAYADCGATFENIAIFNCNPRVYNIGNGGIVGCAGWYANEVVDKPITFKNITVDQTNMISALWGSYDVSCGGILGQYYPVSGQETAPANAGIYMENCHVAAVMDVYNDVCANYQYYWYRYSGMFIGTVRSNKNEGNYTVADTTGIVANNCTYTLGDWNEYWYCELVANSLASYTHDHQFSRLTKVDSVDVANMTVTVDGETTAIPTTGRYNYVVVEGENKTENATCYHFVDGKQHMHEDSGYETFDVDGNGMLDDLKEDRQRYFMPFNQVMSGLGYGVKPTYVFENITNKTDGPVLSTKKFEAKANVLTYRPGKAVKIGDLFNAIVNDEVISNSSVHVAVSPARRGGAVSAIYSGNVSDWQNGTLVFDANASGEAKVVITDYFYCTETVVYLVPEKLVDKYEGLTNEDSHEWDMNTDVTLSDLFKPVNDYVALEGTVTVRATNADGEVLVTRVGLAEDWENIFIRLNSTGVWTISVSDSNLGENEFYANTVTINVVDDALDATEGEENFDTEQKPDFGSLESGLSSILGQ